MPKEQTQASNERENSNENQGKISCTDCKVDLTTGKKSIKCGFCKNQYCCKCSKLKQTLFNEIGREDSILWTCTHCRIAMPGVNQMMSSIKSLELKVGEIQAQIQNQSELPKTDKDLIRQVIREEKEEERESELRKLNIVVHQLPESKLGTLEDRKRDDLDTLQSLVTDALHIDVDIENVFRLGTFSRDGQRTRPVKFTVQNVEDKRRVLGASKNLKNVPGYSNIYFTPDLTRGQRQTAFELRQERRRRIEAGEENLVIRRGKIIKQAPRQKTGDHTYVAPEEVRGMPTAASLIRERARSRSRSPPGSSQSAGSFQ